MNVWDVFAWPFLLMGVGLFLLVIVAAVADMKGDGDDRHHDRH